MRKTATALGAIAAGLAFGAAAPAFAASDDDLTAIRGEIKAMRSDYEHKIESLEKRLRAAEAEAKAAKAAAAKTQTSIAAATAATTTTRQAAPVVMAAAAPPPPPPDAPQAVAPHAPVGPGAFNPAISVILNGSLSSFDHDPGQAHVPGFALGDEAGLADRGFSLGESEVAITANVDHEFLANLIVTINNDQVAVEEGYIQTTSLPDGFTVRAGRFFSGIGYLNEKHAHAWDFEDAPLPYRVLLANQYGDDGVQVRWLAPTDFFLEFGAEAFRGGAFPAGGAANDGVGTFTGYVHAGSDIDEESSFLAGLSYLRSKADNRNTGLDAFTGTDDIFSGTDDLAVASLVYKWAPGGNPDVTNLIANAEYFFGHEHGTFNGVPVDYDRTGFYVQGAYQFMPQWRVGLRYAELHTANVPIALAGTTLDDFGQSPQATTAMLEYDTSEFGRFRLQYTYDESDLRPNNEFVAQYTVSIGPHGAHNF